MSAHRLVLAHLVVLAALAGCSDSHGRVLPRDGGRPWEPDSSVPRDSGPLPVDAGSPLDAGPRGSCDPEDARAAVCPELLCDGLPTWHWNGDSCVPIECGACEGSDCADAPRSQAECEAAHATCEAALCERTGGEWLWWAEECGHYECGVPPPALCLVGMPTCQCGDRQRFDPTLGCVDTECPEVDPLPPDELCRSTGGTWGNFCCNSVCGQYCEAACAAMACHCPGETEVFDSIRGCVQGHECFERELGERCHPRARCEAGTICCDRCGGAGCEGEPRCVVPTCDDDPSTDTCGNDLLAP